MALKDLLALMDNGLESVFHKKAYDPQKDRQWVVDRITKASTQFASTESTRGGGARWWKLSNGVVAFSPTRKDGAPLIINGQTTNFIPSERFEDFLRSMAIAVTGGEFDAELSSESTAGKTVKIKTPRSPSSGGGKGWSPERKAKFEATIAARKASTGS